ncbi:uncharacterized protein LOC113278956 [Papaver somniferum]|uniref:uncharacterized protein LOC113278956 n=1 Tax=Papaver somniferum TaxID=3469 RepID=UPI000E704B93|nr:uncharacterized protein LOC113278956 [Papaver somniferum]
MKTNIISWNIGGLRDSSKRDELKVLLRLWKPDIICLQETHVEGWQRHQVKQFWGGNNFDWIALDSNGLSGGIIVVWNTNKVAVTETLLGDFSVSIRCHFLFENFNWLLTAVYGPVLNNEKNQFWAELRDIRTIWEDPWVLCGDFNATRFLYERSGRNTNTRSMKKFASLVQHQHLMDLPLIGSHYTWSRNSSWSKIDRFLISSSWEDNYRRIEQSTLPKPFSDHHPIMFSTHNEGWGPTPCRFEKMWLQDATILDLMRNWWNSFSFSGTPGYVLAKKMQALKEKLKVWNREVFGKIDTLIQNNLITTHQIESKLLQDPNNLQLASEKVGAKAEFKRLAKMHNDFWKQRATINWVEEYENNTRFFHKYASSKQRAKSFSQLNIDGALTHDKNIIKKAIVSYYQGLFKEDIFSRPQLDGLTFPTISSTDAHMLEARFTQEEVVSALNDLAQDKASGPDGMPIFVISKSWDFMKFDILQVMEELYSNKVIDWILKSTFLVLIPKV